MVMISSRKSLAKTIRLFLNSEITAFEFDDRLEPFWDSDDPVIRFGTESAWCLYDDLSDHLVCLDKPGWDYFQRLLLLLESDCTIESTSRRVWSVQNVIAGITLFLFVGCALLVGWGYHLFLLSVPFGVVSMWLTYSTPPPEPSSDPYEPIIFPFATLSDLEQAYRSTTFRKVQYPKELSGRRIRSELSEFMNMIPTYVTFLCLSPIVLLFQMLPRTESRTRAKAA